MDNITYHFTNQTITKHNLPFTLSLFSSHLSIIIPMYHLSSHWHAIYLPGCNIDMSVSIWQNVMCENKSSKEILHISILFIDTGKKPMMCSGSKYHAPKVVLPIKTKFDTACIDIFSGNTKEMFAFHIFSRPLIYYFLKTIFSTIFCSRYHFLNSEYYFLKN